jgi:hypothetical protein
VSALDDEIRPARLNGELGARLGDGIAASLASTTAGMAVLLALVPTLPSGRRGLGPLPGSVARWSASRRSRLRSMTGWAATARSCW